MEVLRLPGLTPYAAAHQLQQRVLEDRIADRVADTLIVVEHEPTITVGRSRAAEANVLLPGDWPVVQVERGGDVTLHLPGQVVVYPIVKLVGARQDLHGHLRALEDAVFDVCRVLGLEGLRDARNTGVWLRCPDGAVRKVCSVGIACRRWVTWHGLALNVDADLTAFQRIRPCGFEADVMTRLVDHVDVTKETVERLLIDALVSRLSGP